jgi:hypothetical protein
MGTLFTLSRTVDVTRGTQAIAISLLLGLLGGPGVAAAQIPDSTTLLGTAKRAQARLERFRETRLPWVRATGVRACDVQIGRFCWEYDNRSDPWSVSADGTDLVRRREELVDLLDETQLHLPGDGWILGQRIYYRTELGLWDDALAEANSCGAEPWWCSALLGYVRHVRGEFVEAGVAFDLALRYMDQERASRWSSLENVLPRQTRALLEGKGKSGSEWRTLWLLADPLLLVEGNDRKTAHYARQVMSEIRDGARSPHGISWGDDLTEITVRFGWSRGWTRRRSPFGTSGFPTVVGRSTRKGRDWMPPAEVLNDPSGVPEGTWIPEEVTPQNLYTPYYAPDLNSSTGQVAVFHRGDSVLVVAATTVGEARDERTGSELQSLRIDSATVDEVFTWPDLSLRAGPAREGLFLVNSDAVIVARDVRVPAEGRGLLVRAPAGHYWLSLEAWSPQDGRAARLRRGVKTEALEPDLVTLSDLLIMDATVKAFDGLEEMLPFVRPSLELESGGAFTVAWEMYGLGWRDESVRFELALFPAGGGLFSRVGRWFNEGSEDPLRVSWAEAGPADPGPWFRHNRIDLSDLEAGDYVLELRVRLQGREDLSMSRVVRIVNP